MGEVTAHIAGKDKCDEWIVDSGASAHISWNKSLFTNYTILPRKLSVKLGDGRCVSAIAECEKCNILTLKGINVGEGKRHGNLYVLVGEVIVPQVDPPVEHQAASVAIGSDRDLWHNRLGHIGERMLARMTDLKV